MFRHGTGFREWPLKSGGLDLVNLTQGTPQSFDMSDVPTTTGPQANYLPMLLVTIAGVLHQPGATNVVFWDSFMRALVASIEIRNTWHGTPLQASMCLGAYWPIIEYVGMGYRYAARQRGVFPNSNSAFNFRKTFAIPLAVGTGENPLQTAQLALLYKQAQLVLTPAANSVLDSISTGATLTGLTCRVTACLAPRDEIMLAPGVEWIDYSSVAASGQTQIPLKTFGNSTGLNGVEADAGVAFMGFLTSLLGLGGSFTAETITRYSFQWLGQYETQHIDALVSQQIASMGPQRVINGPAQASGSPAGATDMAAFPYTFANDFSSSATGDTNGLMFLPQVTPSADLKLSKLPIAFGEQAFVAAGPSYSGNHHNLVQQVKSWTDTKKADFLKQVITSGLAAQVLGPKGWDGRSELKLRTKTLDEPKTSMSAQKQRFLPRQVVWGPRA
jgi:hypothetical protein